MARVLWIRPPLRGLFPGSNTGSPARNFPVGLAYLNAIAKKAGHESEIIDCLGYIEDSHVIDGTFISPLEEEKLRRFPRPGKRLFHVGASWERIAELLRARRPDVVGISCMFSSYHLSARKVTELVKAISPDSLTILGGQHATSLPHSALESLHTDCIMLGEGETSVNDLLANAADRRALGSLPGLGYRCGTGFCSCALKRAEPHLNPRATWNKDLDGIPFPDPGSLGWASYASRSVLITSRGCPLACTFCSVHDMVGKQHRARSPENVVDEIEHFIKVHGVSRFNIEDDNFTWDVERVRQICRCLKTRNLKVELWLPNGITPIKLGDDLVHEMVDAGFRGLFIGLETTDQKTLVQIKKGFTSLETVTTKLNAFKKIDRSIAVTASLIIGLPGQTLANFALDIIRLCRRDIGYFANPYYAVPGSPDRQKLIACGKLDPSEDPSLTEPWSFHRTFELEPEILYWAQLGAYALRRPDLFVWFREFARNPASTQSRARAIARWLSLDKPVAGKVTPLMSAWPKASLGLWRVLSQLRNGRGRRQDFTFRVPLKQVHAMQFEPYSVWHTPKLDTNGHGIAADFAAMAVSLVSNSSVAVEEVACGNGIRKSESCVFRFSESGLPISAETVRRAFVDAALRADVEETVVGSDETTSTTQNA